MPVCVWVCVCVCASECECCVLPWHFPLRITLLNGFTCATQSAYIKSLIHPIRNPLQSQRLKLCNVGHGWKEAHTKIHKASETAVEGGQSKDVVEGGRGKSTEVGKARSKFGGSLGAPIIQFNHAKCPFTWGGVYYSPYFSSLPLPPQAMTKFLSCAAANEVICMHDNCYCIFFGARANIKIDKMPSNGNETTPPALPPPPPPLADWLC